MHPTADRFATRAREELGFDARIEEFPEGTKTAADAAAAIGCDVGQIVKSLVFAADGDPVVVLTAGNSRVDEAALASELGAEEVRTADADEVKSATGWSIGGVPPFLHETDVPVYLDESLATHDRIWAAAGTPSAVFELSPGDLRRFAGPEEIDVFARS
ncbi:YbaK/EbsC family protein [Halorarum halophilum]|uniref:YbaK/EbsC family protein n=1 Tax=Halorarum halophilum TaxID=2743090 RepID=A0A7D5KKT7_9EURY|nr:YbaK/EbsC family protein [Halobaculum halophilum]QLG26382.1 YbaK/EbsC family protein [Halobaculum halophilum]